MRPTGMLWPDCICSGLEELRRFGGFKGLRSEGLFLFSEFTVDFWVYDFLGLRCEGFIILRVRGFEFILTLYQRLD